MTSKLETIDLNATAVGEWVVWDHAEARRSPDLVEAVTRFESIDCDTGERAANWLRNHALEHERTSRTFLLVVNGEVEGYFSLCGGSVSLTKDQTRDLGVPHRGTLPASILTWIARRRDGGVGGEHLMLKAIGVAREAGKSVASVVLALDPGDEEAARIWIEDYGFRPCEPEEGDEPGMERLYLRID